MANKFEDIRKSSETNFQYMSEQITYILYNIEKKDTTYLIPRYRKNNTSLIKELNRACDLIDEGKGILFAVWEGQWSNDAFVIDDTQKMRLSLST